MPGNESNGSIQNKTLFQVFQVLRFMIWDFFINPVCNSSNNNEDLNSLIMTSRMIRESLYMIFVQKGCFTFKEAKRLNPSVRSLVREISFRESKPLGQQISEMFPYIRKLVLGDDYVYFSDQLPKSLSDPGFNQDLSIDGEKILPSGLTKLMLNCNYQKPLVKSNGDCFLPLSLKRLQFFNHESVDELTVSRIRGLNFGQSHFSSMG